jgi:membrane protein XagC
VRRLVACAPLALLTFTAVLAAATLAVQSGLLPDDAVMLWAAAITAGDGEMSIGRIAAAYPSIPFLSATLLEIVTPAGTPAPAILAAGLLGLLAGTWFGSFRDAGWPLLAAVAATLLLALHPALLRAALAGPAYMFLAGFLYLLGRALYDLRARSGVSEVMAAGLALAGLAFSHPMGAAIAFAATPFLIFAVRPGLAANSALNVTLALMFPTMFSMAAFSYASWVFPGSGWGFLLAPSASLSAWSAGIAPILGEGLTGMFALDAALAVALALILAAPAVPAAVAFVHRRRPLVAPAAVLAAMAIAAAAIAIATGRFGDPSAVIVAGPILAAVVAVRVPIVRDRLAIVVPLLAVGWVGGIVGLAIVDPRFHAPVGVWLEKSRDPERTAALGLGGATIGHDGILVDADNAPAVVLGRGRARGLLSASDETFTLAALLSRIETPFVAVPDPQSRVGATDRLNKAFPLLYRRGVPGYRLVHENQSWRLYARQAETALSAARTDVLTRHTE